LPLVVALHGSMSSARTLQGRAGFDALADEMGFLVAYPNGEGAEGLFRHWNAGHCCGHAKSEGRDDVGFVLRVVDAIGEALPLDRARVYVTGFSNGGMLAYRVGAAHADRIAGIGAVSASIAGAVWSDDPDERMPDPARPVPVVVFQGRDDPRVPAEHVEVSLAWWAERNGCGALPRERPERGGHIRVRAWSDCAAGGALEAWSLDDWGHRWPGLPVSNRRDAEDPLRGFDGSRMMWEFFERNPRSGRRASP
jgi:polyhydroxybutyrate depolymerase